MLNKSKLIHIIYAIVAIASILMIGRRLTGRGDARGPQAVIREALQPIDHGFNGFHGGGEQGRGDGDHPGGVVGGQKLTTGFTGNTL